MGERLTFSPPAPDLSDFSASEGSLAPEKGNFRTLSAPVTLQWELTQFCNERCVHCYNYWRGPQVDNKSIVNPETLKIYEQAAQEIIRNKVFHITVTGGEPLAVFKHAYPYLQKLAESEVGISFNTNLTMFTKEQAQMLRNLGVRSILTSLISGDPDLNDKLANRPNTHRDVSRGIRLALDEGFWVAVNMVVTKKNLHDIYSTAEYVKGLGVETFSATRASTPLNGIDFEEYSLSIDEFKYMTHELLRVQRELGLSVDTLVSFPACWIDNQEVFDLVGGHMCAAGKVGCTIGSSGEIRPCSQLDVSYGSVTNEGGLREAWLKMDPWRTNAFIPETCKPCNIATLCHGGCRAEARASCGGLTGEYRQIHPNEYLIKRPKGQENQIQIKNGEKIRFNPFLKERTESFGGILFLSPQRWLSVGPKLYDFTTNKHREYYTSEEMASEMGYNYGDVAVTINLLLEKSIIIKKGGDNR